MLLTLFWLLTLLGLIFILTYRRSSLRAATVVLGLWLVGWVSLRQPHGALPLLAAAAYAALLVLNVTALRVAVISRPFLRLYKRLLPTMSSTEREALEAGTVWWDGQLFTGNPDWPQLMNAAAPQLTAEEQAFLDGPCEELCRLHDDWQSTHLLGDLSPPVWELLKNRGFFAMIIPKEYGGLGFSAYAHSCVLVKLSSRSSMLGSTVAVPNSLGPAELLLHYGTQTQRDHYLPRLADGREVPCFALTGPRAGSDAASLPDTGVVCRGQWEGREIIGLKLNFSKRYITLAPIATVIGLAFRLFDPDHLLGGGDDRGITVALIPRNTAGIEIGRRHFPLNVPFQNGPIHGHDVFVPLDFIIGGPANIGQGWRMLVEQLSVGRCISLPSSTTGGSKAASFAVGAYGRIRRQFNTSVGRFEGVEHVVARIVGHTYIMDAARAVTAGAIDGGEKPSVPSAMLKYHVTEMGRQVANDVMDVHGGKGICLGPNNFLGRGYQVVPVAITVEGANILTRSLIIFGQGAIRCHPWVLKEMEAARDTDRARGLAAFDTALFGHLGFTLSNATRSLVMALTHARFTKVPASDSSARHFQHINRFSASFAFASDVAMLALGGYLKKKENLSARLGDVLSALYLASMVLKHHQNQGRPAEDEVLVDWACRTLLYKAQEQLHLFLRNFPVRWLAAFMRIFIFPRGLIYFAPSDNQAHQLVDLVMNPGPGRDRLCAGIYRAVEPGNALGLLQEALELSVQAEPLERRLRVEGIKTGRITALDLPGQVDQGEATGLLTITEAAWLRDYDRKVMAMVHVDDFAPHELGMQSTPTSFAAAHPQLA